jgi:hypothetical protein
MMTSAQSMMSGWRSAFAQSTTPTLSGIGSTQIARACGLSSNTATVTAPMWAPTSTKTPVMYSAPRSYSSTSGEPATPPKTEPAMARSEVSSRQASSAELPRGVVSR